MTPSTASVQALTATVKTLCRHAAGATPAQRIDTVHPLRRGGANYHRHRSWSETLARLDSCVWRRRYRGAKRRPPHKTGRWLTERYCPHQPGESWRYTAPTTGQHRLRLQAAVTPQRHIKGKRNAKPCDPLWEASFQDRDRHLALQRSAAFRATRLRQQTGCCPLCRQRIDGEEPLARHHRHGIHQHNQRENLVRLPPNCHRQGHDAPDSTTTVPRPARGVGHACAECRDTGSLRSEGAGWA
jgi:RNA-directed DNA polymerase